MTIVEENEYYSEKIIPKFKKLGTGGDIYAWLREIELHFVALGL